jgi:hypothetical protein
MTTQRDCEDRLVQRLAAPQPVNISVPKYRRDPGCNHLDKIHGRSPFWL